MRWRSGYKQLIWQGWWSWRQRYEK